MIINFVTLAVLVGNLQRSYHIETFRVTNDWFMFLLFERCFATAFFCCYSLNRCFIPDHSFSRIYFSLVERFLSIHFHFHITIYLSLSGKAQQQQQQPEMKEDDEFIYRENNGQIERQKNKSSTVIVMSSVCLL